MDRSVLAGLRPREYEHPYDRRALAALEGNSALGLALSKLNQYGLERIMRVQFAGSNVRATKRSFGEACDALAETCDILELSRRPDLYVDWDERLFALTVCTEKPVVVVSSALLQAMSFDELLFVLGHEIGHIKNRQVMYSQLALVLPAVGEVLKSATFGIGGLVSGGLQLSLNNWQRMSDFTADRAGLLACQSIEAASLALIKLGGAQADLYHSLDVPGFVAQAREFGGYDFETLDKLVRVVSALRADQHWTVLRASELIKWLDSGAYDGVLRRPVSAATAGAAAAAPAVAAPAPAAAAVDEHGEAETPSAADESDPDPVEMAEDSESEPV